MTKKVVPEQDCGLFGHSVNAPIVDRGSAVSVADSGGEGAARQETIPFVAAAGAAYGHIAGLILCLIRYRCNVPGPDRIETDEGRLWRVSYARIASDLGMSRQQVQRAMSKLEGAGALVVEYRPEKYGDQRRSFRVVPDPNIWSQDSGALTCESSESNRSENSSTCESSESNSESVRSRTGTGSGSNSLPFSEEVEGGGEEGGGSGRARAPRGAGTPDPCSEFADPGAVGLAAGASFAPEVRPSEHCPRHPGGTLDPCRACGDARRAAEAWDAGKPDRDRVAAAARRAAIAACVRCDEHGQIDEGDAVRRCDHRPAVEVDMGAEDRSGVARPAYGLAGAPVRRQFVRPSQREAVTV